MLLDQLSKSMGSYVRERERVRSHDLLLFGRKIVNRSLYIDNNKDEMNAFNEYQVELN